MSRSSLLGAPPHPCSSMTRMGTSRSTSPCCLIHHGLSWDWCHGANGKQSKRDGVIESRLLTPLTSMSRSANTLEKTPYCFPTLKSLSRSRGSVMSTAINGVLGSERGGSGRVFAHSETTLAATALNSAVTRPCSWLLGIWVCPSHRSLSPGCDPLTHATIACSSLVLGDEAVIE
jgi:hypothetical protein